MHPEPTHILWDHDGVLVDTEPLYFEANRRALEKVGIQMGVGQYLELMAAGGSAFDLAREAGVAEAEIVRWRDQRNVWYQQLIAEGDIDIEGVEDVLSSLSANYRMAIVTTCKPEDFRFIHENRTITSYMDFVLTSGDYPRSKPEPDPYLAALDRYGISAEQAVVVEDSQRGLSSALAAGIRCVVVDNAFTRTHDFSGAIARIGSLKELPEVLST